MKNKYKVSYFLFTRKGGSFWGNYEVEVEASTPYFAEILANFVNRNLPFFEIQSVELINEESI